MTRLIQLIYVSRFVAGNRGLLSEMRNILTSSRANNYHNQLTGCLLFDRDIFVQVIEGEPERVRACFERIAADPRHEAIRILKDAPIPARDFPVWAMAGFVKSEANESLFRRHRFLTQKSTGRFEPHRLIALANALVGLDQPSVLSDIRRSLQTKESDGKDSQTPFLETGRTPDCDGIVVSAKS